MSDVARKFHEAWLGMVQPSEGLVVSVPVLVDAQCMEKQDHAAQDALLSVTGVDAESRRTISSLPAFFEQVLGLTKGLFDDGANLPQAVSRRAGNPAVLMLRAREDSNHRLSVP